MMFTIQVILEGFKWSHRSITVTVSTNRLIFSQGAFFILFCLDVLISPLISQV